MPYFQRLVTLRLVAHRRQERPSERSERIDALVMRCYQNFHHALRPLVLFLWSSLDTGSITLII